MQLQSVVRAGDYGSCTERGLQRTELTSSILAIIKP